VRVRPLGVLVLACGAQLAACKGTEPFVPRPTTVSLSLYTVEFSALGQTQSISATVLDQHGEAMPQAGITWESTNPAVAEVTPSTSSTALVSARGNGTAQIRAHSGTVVGRSSATVAQLVAGMMKTAGDDQVDTVGRALPVPLVATVTDALGNPMPNVRVNFQETAGGGSLTAQADTSGANGQVQVNWTLGTSTGTQTVVFTEAGGVGGIVVFHAVARSGPPVSLTPVAGDGQRARVGTQVPIAPAVLLLDVFGNPAANVVVTFDPTVGGGGVANPTTATDANGVASTRWTLGSSAGENNLIATGPSGLTHTFVATALILGPPAAIVIIAGDNQVGLTGYPLNTLPAVQVQDTAGLPLENVQVAFTLSGGGTVTGSPAATDSSGIATVGSWTVETGSNTLTASIAGSSVFDAHIRATGATQQFEIDLRILTAATTEQLAAFVSARTRWRLLNFGDQPDVFVSFPGNQCAPDTPPIDETVDDIVILVRLDSIDGPGKILGRAGPCIIRNPSWLPLVSLMQFDTADVAPLLASGHFEAVVLHEMAHALGFTAGIWDGLGLIVGRARSGGTDPHFIGIAGTAAFDRNGGLTYSTGAKVPLENCSGCSLGTLDSHWRESVFESEMMTGFIEASGPVPLSEITTAALGDMGYAVNYAASDTYAMPLVDALRAATPAIELGDDVLRLPITVVDPRGRVLRVILPR